MLKNIKQCVETETKKYAIDNIIGKLKQQNIDYKQLLESEFDSLVADEMEILMSESKKVGAGIGIAIAISLLTGI